MTSIDSQKELFHQVNVSCFWIEVDSVEKATSRIFKVGAISVLSHLKELCVRFGLKWNFESTRSGKTITCNRANRRTSYVSSRIKKSSSTTCVCGWLVRFKGVE